MPTLDELLNDSLGASKETIKTASTQMDNEIEKLATEIGLFGESEASDNTSINKEANMSLNVLYGEMFPGSDAQGQEKTATINKKAAAVERAKGAYAQDVFQSRVADHIMKIAEALVEANVTEETHPQAMENNEDQSEDAIDTTPEVQDELMGTNPEGAVGEFENVDMPEGEQIKAAALRKHLLLARLSK